MMDFFGSILQQYGLGLNIWSATFVLLISIVLLLVPLFWLRLNKNRRTIKQTPLRHNSEKLSGNPENKFNVLLYALGTRGDVEPMLVLATELKNRKEISLITICATEDFVSLIEKEHGFKFASCGIKTIKNQDEEWIKAKSQGEFLYALSQVGDWWGSIRQSNSKITRKDVHSSI